MLDLANEGDAVREDVGCGILYAVLRDSAYKITDANRDSIALGMLLALDVRGHFRR